MLISIPPSVSPIHVTDVEVTNVTIGAPTTGSIVTEAAETLEHPEVLSRTVIV